MKKKYYTIYIRIHILYVCMCVEREETCLHCQHTRIVSVERMNHKIMSLFCDAAPIRAEIAPIVLAAV
uniref:Uncharacterized protein n=1 Tax=Anopheles minimus TaxID=112268 RepID=A0A182WMQ3_9DIPT